MKTRKISLLIGCGILAAGLPLAFADTPQSPVPPTSQYEYVMPRSAGVDEVVNWIEEYWAEIEKQPLGYEHKA